MGRLTQSPFSNTTSDVATTTWSRDLLLAEDAAAGRAELGLALADAPLLPSSATASEVVVMATVQELDGLTVADIKAANAVAGWATANDTHLTGSIGGGAVTLSRANAGSTDSRAGGTFPMWYTTASALNDELVVRMRNPATANYCVAGLFVWDGGNEFCGFAQWNTTLELHADPAISGVSNIIAQTIVAEQYVWQKVRRIGPVCIFYYSLATNEPTETSNSTSDEATKWVRAGRAYLIEAGATTWPRLGIGLSYPLGTLQAYTVDCPVVRYTTWP